MQNPVVTFQTSQGVIKAELYPDVAPNTVNNFISLVKKGFYDGTIFHRVIPGFMIQGGDPEGSGMGGPGYGIKGEFASNGVKNDLKHTTGVLSMARAQMPDSAGSQFFIMVDDAPYPHGRCGDGSRRCPSGRGSRPAPPAAAPWPAGRRASESRCQLKGSAVPESDSCSGFSEDYPPRGSPAATAPLPIALPYVPPSVSVGDEYSKFPTGCPDSSAGGLRREKGFPEGPFAFFLRSGPVGATMVTVNGTGRFYASGAQLLQTICPEFGGTP